MAGKNYMDTNKRENRAALAQNSIKKLRSFVKFCVQIWNRISHQIYKIYLVLLPQLCQQANSCYVISKISTDETVTPTPF
jgi:hypothetical protein